MNAPRKFEKRHEQLDERLVTANKKDLIARSFFNVRFVIF